MTDIQCTHLIHVTVNHCHLTCSLKTHPLSSLRSLRFSFFSRDKQRSLHQSAQFDIGSWAGKDNVYTEQAQEALQHM